jgi:hypothetical protein
MELTQENNEYLKKTYCHLVNNVRPQNDKNMNEFPPAKMWVGIATQIDEAIKDIEVELVKRKISCEC